MLEGFQLLYYGKKLGIFDYNCSLVSDLDIEIDIVNRALRGLCNFRNFDKLIDTDIVGNINILIQDDTVDKVVSIKYLKYLYYLYFHISVK